MTNTPVQTSSLQRVTCYIDGFNLYHCLKRIGGHRFYWLDLHALVTAHLTPNQVLTSVHYFTSRIKGDPDGFSRQNIYLSALETLPNLSITFGNFLETDVTCKRCGLTYRSHEEKRTDVNIACHMLTDAMDNRFDTALLLTADSDLAPPANLVRNRFQKRVVALFPPDRHSETLRKTCNGYLFIGKAALSRCLLPEEIVVTPTKTLRRPKTWY